MGDHRRVEEMLKVLKPILSKDTFSELCPGYIDGVPNIFHANVPHEEFELYKDNANQRNIAQHPNLVKNQVIKEDAKDLSFAFDERFTDFMPHCGLIPVGIATPDNKKPRLYRHGSKMLSENSQPINTIVDAKATEPEIRFGGALKRHCQNCYRLRATYPN
jgi:hypothetical protein